MLNFGGETMGTRWRVHCVVPPGSSETELRRAAEAELDRAVALFSHWEPSSELGRFNAAPPGPFAASPAFLRLIGESLAFAERTGGAVDPTLGVLVDLWGFGPPGPRPDGRAPSLEEIERARIDSGWRRLTFDGPGGLIVQPGGLRLDLSGLAKGWAVDQVSSALTTLGATHHLVEIGGELVGRGIKPDGQPWWVEIEAPAAGSRTLAALFDLAVATSGDGERRADFGGRIHGHTIDGRTGRPTDPTVASVTVFAETAFEADAWATALTVLGSEGPARAEREGLAALFTLRSASGLAERTTAALKAMLEA